jgi:hypothetical protein
VPLVDGYGVVIGTLDHFQRDPINNYGQYYHENAYVSTPAGIYKCAIDVDSKMTNGEPDGRKRSSCPLRRMGPFSGQLLQRFLRLPHPPLQLRIRLVP